MPWLILWHSFDTSLPGFPNIRVNTPSDSLFSIALVASVRFNKIVCFSGSLDLTVAEITDDNSIVVITLLYALKLWSQLMSKLKFGYRVFKFKPI